MLFVCATLVTMLALGSPTGAPPLGLDHDRHRAAPTLIDIAPAPAPAAHNQRASLRVSHDVDVSAITLMKSLGGATYYRLAPGLALGAGSSVATLDRPGGPMRALQLLTMLRFKF